MGEVQDRLSGDRVAWPFVPGLSVEGGAGWDAESHGLTVQCLDDLESIVITKWSAGFDERCVRALSRIVGEVASGFYGPVKFLAFDFAHRGSTESVGAEGFDALLGAVSNLILEAPIVSIASARAPMAGADLEFALACSLMIGERGVPFSFAADPVTSIGIYASLAQKIGFVKAERLMESEAVLDADQMHELLLLKDVGEQGAGMAGIKEVLRLRTRRHNSSCGIYRAQRISMPAFYRRLPAPPRVLLPLE